MSVPDPLQHDGTSVGPLATPLGAEPRHGAAPSTSGRGAAGVRRPQPGGGGPARPIPMAAGAAPQAGMAAGGRPIPVQAPLQQIAPGMATLRQEEEQPDEEKQVRSFLQGVPPWLVSFVFHVLLLVVLGLIAWTVLYPSEVVVEMKDDIWAEELGEQLENDKVTLATDDPQEEQIISESDLPPVDDPFSAPPESIVSPNAISSTSNINAPDVGNHLTGRERGRKQSLVAAYGGTRRTEEAVRLALEWLARNQRADGSWSLCGPYSDGAPEQYENVVAATSMALLAFQGAGHVHNKPSDFQQNVARGWEAMLRFVDKEGNFVHNQPIQSHHRLYTQAQASIAVCELWAMTQDEKYKPIAQAAIDYAVRIQDRAGGWRYQPGSDSDLSVTGWFVMALQSGRMGGLNVPEPALENISRFLETVAAAGGSRYRYYPGSGREATTAMTAEGLLCRQYLGWARNDQRLQGGADFLAGNLINYRANGRDVYYWYYATQVMHHMERDHWRAWNNVMRQVLPENQIQTKGHKERGSWNPQGDVWGDVVGRLYVTCLTTYMLEVYYRHLPIYSDIYRYVRPEMGR